MIVTLTDTCRGEISQHAAAADDSKETGVFSWAIIATVHGPCWMSFTRVTPVSCRR